MNLGKVSIYGHMWGTVGSGLITGASLDRRGSKFLDSIVGKIGIEICFLYFFFGPITMLVPLEGLKSRSGLSIVGHCVKKKWNIVT